MDGILRSCPVGAEVLKAVDGREMTPADHLAFRARMHRPHYPFHLRDSEVATFLSHRKAWSRLVDDGLDAALVLEDDVDLGEEFSAAFELARRTLQPDDIIRFPAWKRERPAEIVAREGKVRIFKPLVVGLGMQAQLVGRGAASKLLEQTKAFDRPVDSAVQMDWITGVRTLTAMPSGLREVSGRLGGSLIGRRKSMTETMHREVMRPIYRWAIARRSRQSNS